MASAPIPPGLDLGQSRVSDIVSALSVTWALAGVAVVLRFAARRIQANPLWVEDWLIAFSLIAAGVHVFISIGYMVPHGTGKHIWVAPPTATKAWAIGLFVSEMAYTATLSTVKWSTLALYWRIFNARKSIRVLIWVLCGIVSAWAIAVFLVTLFQCIPVNAFWDRFDTENPMAPEDFRCGVDVKMFFKGNSIPNIITDALIIILPIPYVWSLQLQRAQKVALAGIFALGTFVTIVSMLRLHVILSVDLASPDITWNFIDTIVWTNVEANTAIICACLPCLKPLLSLALKGKLRSTAKQSNKNSGGRYILNDLSNGVSHSFRSGTPGPVAIRKGVSATGPDDERPFTRLSEQESSKSNDERDSNHDIGEIVQGKGILVTKEFDMKDTCQRS